jgi:hypothetical protein
MVDGFRSAVKCPLRRSLRALRFNQSAEATRVDEPKAFLALSSEPTLLRFIPAMSWRSSRLCGSYPRCVSASLR